MGSITIVGLGAGSFDLITLGTWEKMQQAQQLLLRTAKHPTVDEIKKRGVSFSSYDAFYENKATFDEVYTAISVDVIEKAAAGVDVVYAVPGSPLVAERTVVLIRDMAKERGIAVDILPGMSFAEVLYVRLGIDPIEGLTIVDAADLEHLPAQMPTALVVTQVYNGQVASDTKLSLMETYPDDHNVVLVQNLGLPDEKISPIELFELDRQQGIDHLTSLYVPPLDTSKKVFTLDPLVDIMATLRSPGGCPWDLLQSHESLRRNLIEEVYEVIEAIDLKDVDLLCEELGDLLLQIVFHARMAEECGDFSMQDVVDGIVSKLVRRHPHVFGDVSLEDAAAVITSWDNIKKEEKKERKSVLDGVPKDLPALMSAYKLQHKASKVGFDWAEMAPVWGKIAEEIDELKAAVASHAQNEIEEELGDVLFSVVNLSRFLHVDAEVALNGTNRKFCTRFMTVEKLVKASGRSWATFSLAELDEFWNAAKRKKKAEK